MDELVELFELEETSADTRERRRRYIERMESAYSERDLPLSLPNGKEAWAIDEVDSSRRGRAEPRTEMILGET
jgi:hypothetical protein